MSYHPDSFVTSPGSTDPDPTWQLHSSTDSYLNWDAPQKSPISHDQNGARVSTPSTAPTMSRLRSTASTMTPPPTTARTPTDPPSIDAASILSHHGHTTTTTSPERSVSPSYFTKLYFQVPNRTSSGTSPTITFTGAPAEPPLDASARTPSLLPESSYPGSEASSARRSSVSGATSSPIASSSTPLSPTMSSKSNTSSGGFFSSLRPSSPGNVTSTLRTQDGDGSVKARRPSSVFEHVGNVWERFGRKVHHTRTGTSEQPPASSLHARRTASQTSPPIGLAPELTDPIDTARFSPSGSVASQASPSQSTATESECRTPATPSGENSASLSTPQPLPSAPAYSSITAASSAVHAPQQEEVEELPYLAPEAPDLNARGSGGTDASSIPSGQRSQTSHRRTSSLFERVLIQVTDDNERFSVVDISGVDSSDAIKERMFAKLHLFDADHSSFQLYRTEIGQAEATGPVVSDDALLVLCLQMGDDRGTLKFLVQQTALPPNATSRAVPPLASAGNHQRVLKEDRRTSASGSAASQHMRTESQSSKSSLSDAWSFPTSLARIQATKDLIATRPVA